MKFLRLFPHLFTTTILILNAELKLYWYGLIEAPCQALAWWHYFCVSHKFFFLPPSLPPYFINLIYTTKPTQADHVQYLWIIIVRECYDILPVITLETKSTKQSGM